MGCTLKIMCGVPGSGKDYYIQHHIKRDECEVSRDKIRFSIIKDNDKYFAKEDEVFKAFCDEISADSMVYSAVYANATHLADKNRWKLLNNINLNGFNKIVFICIETPLQRTLQQNAKRTGRAFVPEEVVKKMAKSYHRPNLNYWEEKLGIPVEIEVVKNERA
mgnify:CR=1 FL=1